MKKNTNTTTHSGKGVGAIIPILRSVPEPIFVFDLTADNWDVLQACHSGHLGTTRSLAGFSASEAVRRIKEK